MRQNIICLDLGSKNLHMVQGRYKNGSIILNNATQFSLQEGILNNGNIEDFERLKSSIKTLITENRIKEKNVVLTIQSTSIITRDIVLPSVKPQQLSNMVKYEIEQHLPIVATEYIIEYSVINEIESEDGHNNYSIQVAAMPKYMVESYLSLINDIGLKPIALDIHPNAVSKLIAQTKAINGKKLNTQKTLAFIDLGYRSINIHIISGGKLEFSRIINLGAKELDNKISTEYHMSLEQAEKKKIQHSNLYPDVLSELTLAAFQELVRMQVDIWISEIQKIFQYYISRTTGNRIEAIYLYGGSSQLRGLNKYFQHIFNIPTVYVEDIDIIKMATNSSFNLRNYINALGGLIRYE